MVDWLAVEIGTNALSKLYAVSCSTLPILLNTDKRWNEARQQVKVCSSVECADTNNDGKLSDNFWGKLTAPRDATTPEPKPTKFLLSIGGEGKFFIDLDDEVLVQGSFMTRKAEFYHLFPVNPPPSLLWQSHLGKWLREKHAGNCMDG